MPGQPQIARHAHHPSSSPAGARWRIRAGSLALHPPLLVGARRSSSTSSRAVAWRIQRRSPGPFAPRISCARSTRWTAPSSRAPSGPFVRQIRADLTRTERGPSVRMDVHAGVAASSHARRDALREAGPGHGTFSGGAALTLYLGPAVVVSHPYFDTRLKWDPDWYGKKDRIIAGKGVRSVHQRAISVRGAVLRHSRSQLGPSAVQGLLLSDSPYGPDHLSITIGTSGLRLDGIATQLNSRTDTAGLVHNRYMYLAPALGSPPAPRPLDVRCVGKDRCSRASAGSSSRGT